MYAFSIFHGNVNYQFLIYEKKKNIFLEVYSYFC